MSDTWKRFFRTLIQLAAGGTFTVLYSSRSPTTYLSGYTPYILIVSTLVVTLAQNTVEDATGKSILK
jgi:hypothetical protein